MKRPHHDDQLMSGFDNDPLITPLREALRPVPLDAALIRRIESQWTSNSGLRWGWFAWAPAALVAAALAFLFVFPPITLDNSAPLDLVAEDTDAVLAAYAEGRWRGTTDAVIEHLLEKVQDLTEELGSPSAGSLADDWDLPSPRAEEATPGRSGRRLLKLSPDTAVRS